MYVCVALCIEVRYETFDKKKKEGLVNAHSVGLEPTILLDVLMKTKRILVYIYSTFVVSWVGK